MSTFRINYIDGHDLRYKSFETSAEDPADAVRILRSQYEQDFDHQIAEVIEIDAEPGTRMRIGSIPAPSPFLI